MFSSGTQELSVKKNLSIIAKSFPEDELKKWEPLENKVVVVKIFSNNKKLASASKVFTKTKDLKLHTDKPYFEVSKIKDGYLLTLKSTILIKGLQISCSEDGVFSDNYFDLLPRESKVVFFETKLNSIAKNDFGFLYLTE